MKFRELMAQLQELHEKTGIDILDMEIKGWLPGSTLSIDKPFIHRGKVMIEMNLDPGSALSQD